MIQFIDFGADNYSHGMKKICFSKYDYKFDLLDLLNMENVYLHPTKEEDSCDVYGFYGTQEQYNELFTSLRDCWCSNRALEAHPYFSWSNPSEINKEELRLKNAMESELKAHFTPWWMKKIAKIQFGVCGAGFLGVIIKLQNRTGYAIDNFNDLVKYCSPNLIREAMIEDRPASSVFFNKLSDSEILSFSHIVSTL